MLTYLENLFFISQIVVGPYSSGKQTIVLLYYSMMRMKLRYRVHDVLRYARTYWVGSVAILVIVTGDKLCAYDYVLLRITTGVR